MKLDGDATTTSGRLVDLLSTMEGHAMTLEDRVTQLFVQLREPVYRYVLMLLWDSAESEEITQETFLRLHRHLAEGRKIENVKAWVLRVAHNLAIDRGRTSRPTDSLSEETVRAKVESRQISSTANPEEDALAKERFEQLARAVDVLPARQRQCLHLRSEGFRYREIAMILGVSEATVVEHVRRAMTRLAKEFYVSR